MKGKFIPENPGENVSYPGKKLPRPGPTRNKIPQPENILLKCSPTPDRFRFGPGKMGVSGCLSRRFLSHTTYYVQNEWSHSLLQNSVQARQKIDSLHALP